MKNYNWSKKIINFRKRNQLTQAKLAEQLGVDTSLVCLWEKRKRIPGGYRMLKLMKILDIKMDDIKVG